MSSLELSPTRLFIVLIFIIVVYISYALYDPRDPMINAGLGVVGTVFIGLVYYGWNAESENLDIGMGGPDVQLRPTTNDAGQMNDQDYNLAQMGNISQMWDAEAVSQIDRDLVHDNPAMDNSDVVDQYAGGGHSTHVPLESQSSDFHMVHDLTYPKHPGMEIGDAEPDHVYSEYRVPLNERAMSVDDKLARKQHHRADMNKKAIDGAVRATRSQFERFFSNELAENYATDWWDGEADDMETDYQYL